MRALEREASTGGHARAESPAVFSYVSGRSSPAESVEGSACA